MNAMSDALAAGLADLGIQKGDRVAIYMRNSIELVTAFYALEKLGVVVAWVNPMYRQTEAEFILKNSEARGVFIFKEWENYDYLQAVSNIQQNLPGLEFILVAGEGAGGKGIELEELLEQGKGRSLTPASIDTKNDLAMLIYTSGTTGKPKGAMITHYQAVRAGMEYSYGDQCPGRGYFYRFSSHVPFLWMRSPSYPTVSPPINRGIDGTNLILNPPLISLRKKKSRFNLARRPTISLN